MSSHFTINNARLSFPHIFEKATYDGKETKYEATLLISKDDEETIKKIKKAIHAALLEKFNTQEKIPKGITKGVRNCLRDGDDVEYDGYANHMSFKAGNSKRPRTLGRDKRPVEADSGLLYAGCYVDVIVEIWVQDNQYGRRINANLMAVRHRADGEPFGAGVIPDGIEDGFEELDEEPVAELDEGEYDI